MTMTNEDAAEQMRPCLRRLEGAFEAGRENLIVKVGSVGQFAGTVIANSVRYHAITPEGAKALIALMSEQLDEAVAERAANAN